MWVTLCPAAAYRSLARQPAAIGIWRALRRPLFVAFVLGCTMSLIASAGLTPRLAGSATVYWSFVPLAEMVGLAAACGRDGRTLAFPRAIDLFFAGHGPWLFWLIGLSAIWSFTPPIRAFALTNAIWLYGAGGFALLWSAYVDFCFFRFALARSMARAGRDLVLHRLISWTIILAIFGGPAIPPAVAARLGW